MKTAQAFKYQPAAHNVPTSRLTVVDFGNHEVSDDGGIVPFERQRLWVQFYRDQGYSRGESAVLASQMCRKGWGKDGAVPPERTAARSVRGC